MTSPVVPDNSDEERTVIRVERPCCYPPGWFRRWRLGIVSGDVVVCSHGRLRWEFRESYAGPYWREVQV